MIKIANSENFCGASLFFRLARKEMRLYGFSEIYEFFGRKKVSILHFLTFIVWQMGIFLFGTFVLEVRLFHRFEYFMRARRLKWRL